MRSQVTLFLGVFSVMALSNAIVPVLPAFAEESAWQGVIYSAYFLGAVASTLPAGVLSDRYSRISLMRTGLALTVISGLLLVLVAGPVPALTARLLEGIGAGLFIPPALSCINREAEHEKMSGYFMALLNTGLVLGLLIAGFLATSLHETGSGLLFFTLLATIPVITSLMIREPPASPAGAGHDLPAFLTLVRDYRWIWYSSIVLIGITGVATSLYPEFSHAPPDLVSIWIAGMSIATIVAVLLISRLSFDDILAIRISAVLMALGILVSFFSPAGFLVLGAVAGIVMIAQMEYLSRLREHQGIAMGLFSTTSYLGMAILPFLAGLVADMSGFFAAFCLTAVLALTVLITQGRP